MSAIAYVTNGWIGAGLIVAVLAFTIALQGRQIRAANTRRYEQDRIDRDRARLR